jgi:hypothetical protein
VSNELKPGTRRSGTIYDDNSDSPKAQVDLEWSDRGIRLQVRWTELDDYHASWFIRDIFQGLPFANAPLPKQLLFEDNSGCVLLVGCKADGHSGNQSGGTGWLTVSYAVLGVDRDDLDFDKVVGVRSTISGLREWIGVGSVQQNYDVEARTMTVTAKAAAAIYVRSGASFVPGWREGGLVGESGVSLADVMHIETTTESPQTWEDLTEQHGAVRDLLSFSRDRKEVVSTAQVMHADDHLTSVAGTEHASQWRTVVSSFDEVAPPSPRRPMPHLIPFDEIGIAGLNDWFHIRSDFDRALNPLIVDRFLRGAPFGTHLTQVGPGLEALGYLLFRLDDKKSEKGADQSLQNRLERILKDVGAALPFDGPTWATSMKEAYNGIKHANRHLPGDLDVGNRWRESVVVVRAWVACRLGIDPALVRRRLELDPAAGRIVQRS